MKLALKTLLWCLVPAAFVCEHFHEELHVSASVLFAVAGLALLPLAGLMGHATEHLAARLGAGIGGLLNASFGNAAELIIAFMALRSGLTEVVKASITGSIVGNSLLVLGLSVVTGGLRHATQRFNPTAAGVGATLLALSAAALILPATFHHLSVAVPGGAPALRISEEKMSLVISCVLFLAYVASLVFTLRTHKHLYAGEEDPHPGPVWSWQKALTLLALSTVGVAFLSEILVKHVEEMSKSLGFTPIFVGVMLVAILGNAAEHSTAVVMAWRNHMDAAIGISVGSSVQIALFVAPVLVFASQLYPRKLDLVFSPAEVIAVTLSAWVVSLVANDGESNWLEGVLLLAVYAVLGVTFYFLPG